MILLLRAHIDMKGPELSHMGSVPYLRENSITCTKYKSINISFSYKYRRNDN